MAMITTERATPDRWVDVQHSLTGGGDGASCQCAWLVLRAKDFNRTSTSERIELLRDEIAAGPPPGLIAYVDGEAAGWVRVGPRILHHRIIHTRAIAAATTVPFDDEGVWAISCFVVRREHRGQGVTVRLLQEAIAYARESGARLIEAYPIDTSAGTLPPNDLYHGTLSTFLSSGFQQQREMKPGRPLVVLDLDV